MDDFNDVFEFVSEEPKEVLIDKKEDPIPKKSVKSKVFLEKGNLRKTDELFSSMEKLDLVIKASPTPKAKLDQVEDPKVVKDPTKDNKLLDIIKKKGFNSDLEKEALRIVAEEIAYLGAVRENQYLANLDTSKISLRRVQSIQSLLEIIAKKQDGQGGSGGKAVFDFSSDTFRKVFQHILKIISITFDQVSIPDSYKQVFFVSLSKNLENFEQEANAIVKGKEVIPGKELEKEEDEEEDED